jgi:hypothetical protein
MSTLPLTHHEILTLVEPFTRSGRQVDLGASDRLARRILFRPRDHAAPAPPATPLRETLVLESLATGSFCLTRSAVLAGSPAATLTATGVRPAELLAAIEAVDPWRHFSLGSGYRIVRSYSLHWIDGAAGAAAPPALTEAQVLLDGVSLTLQLSGVRGVGAEISLLPAPGRVMDCPEDLLAVLGWNWARLVRTPLGWRSRLRLRGDARAKTVRAERALDRVAAHLARTLAEPPTRFHERLVLARWGVFLRRGIPVWTFLALLLAVAVIPRSVVEGNPRAWILLFHVPTALIALSFCLQELPQYEIPPIPRRGSQDHWLRSAQGEPV